jgi:hypothetical protein
VRETGIELESPANRRCITMLPVSWLTNSVCRPAVTLAVADVPEQVLPVRTDQQAATANFPTTDV